MHTHYSEYIDDSEYDDLCCYDPRYRGEKGSCHCRDIAEADRYENLWYVRILRFFQYKWYDLSRFSSRVKNLFNTKGEFTEDDLPF